MRRRLAAELRVSPEAIGHCIDREKHSDPEIGHNLGFKAMIGIDKAEITTPVLVAKKPDGGEVVVPYTYIGSRFHTGTTGNERFVHFYLINRQHTPPPVI